MSALLESARALLPEIQALKDDLHRHPELSFQEKRTTRVVREHLAPLGVEFVDLGMDTGVVAVLTGAKPGPCAALRADMDAIAQQEKCDGPVISQVPGVMHGCGHDFHTACLYGAARLLAEQREKLAGQVVFLFQPAEEVTQGAAAMVEHGLWEKLPRRPQFLFGLHNRPELPVGQVAVMEGPVMAGKSHFTITVTGRSGHGGSPHKCADVIVAASAVVGALQTVVSRNIDPLDALVCSVCSIHAGTPDNFVPDTLTMTGSIRAHSAAAHRLAERRVEELAQGVCASYGCSARIEIHPGVPATVNSPAMTALARKAAAAVAGEANLVAPRPDMGSEDFAVLAQAVPAFFYWLGSGTPGRDNPCWHNECFATDDRALPLGAALLAQSALTALESCSSF
jgi:amidohydrolase